MADVLADVLWKYYKYARFGLMLIGLWIVMSLIRSCAILWVPVDNHQMAPTYVGGQHVLIVDPSVNKQPQLKYGDAVQYGDTEFYKDKERVVFVGRIVAFGGDIISADSNGRLMVNNRTVNEVAYLPGSNLFPLVIRPMVIPTGYVYILNDSREGLMKMRKSYYADSRYFGPIPEWAVVGRIERSFKYK
jgi:signal peptidase I